MHTFVPSGQLEPHRSMFSTQKRWDQIKIEGGAGRAHLPYVSTSHEVPHWFPDMEVQKALLPPPPKNGFLAQKRPNLVQHQHFWSNIGLFVPFGPTTKRGAQVVFLSVSTKTFASLCKNYGFWPQKRSNLAQNSATKSVFILEHGFDPSSFEKC